jgi:hypothetical protein
MSSSIRNRRIQVIAMLASVVAVGSCATFSGPPDNIENACAIFEDRPSWADAIADSERRWGAPAEVQLAIMWRESKFRDDARPPKNYVLGIVPWGRKSSAYGYSQALDGTWDWYRKDTRNGGADRDDFADAADFVGWYMTQTARSNGAAMNDAYTQYLAYHEGHTGYRRGDWRQKGWLIDAARQVENMAARYRNQLASCRGVYTA